MQNIEIRDFCINDLKQLYRLTQETIELSYKDIYPAKALEFFKNYHSEKRILARAAKGMVEVAVMDQRVVATGSLVQDEVSGVFVYPGMQRSGVGKAIMFELEKEARKAGITEINLHVSLPAIEFYTSLHYDIKTERYIDVGDGEILRYFEGKKKLQQ